MCFSLVNNHPPFHRLFGIPEHQRAGHSHFSHPGSQNLYDIHNCSITYVQPYVNPRHTAVMSFPFSGACGYGPPSPPRYRENPRGYNLMSQDHSSQQVILSETQGHPYGTWCMYPMHSSRSYPMMLPAAPNAFLSVCPDSRVATTSVPLYPTATMHGYPSLNPLVYQTVPRIPGGWGGWMASDTPHTRPYHPPFRPAGNSYYGQQAMMPTCHYVQGEHCAPTDQRQLSPGEYIDSNNPKAVSSELEEQIRFYARYETQLAENLDIPTDKLDPLKVSRKVEDLALRTEDSSSWWTYLNILNTLHILRLQYHRALPDSFGEVKMEAPHPPPGVPHRVDGVRFWAILIGIDAYESDSLDGCVNDVRAMEKYLLDVLHVPKEHIQLLLGLKEPTSSHDAMDPSRDNIINALFSVITNNQIVPGDNIIFFFAGHGSYYFPSEDDDKALLDLIGPRAIEAICPIDRDKLDASRVPIPDISNRELNSIFSLIAKEKGNHITAIFDCCHSGGMCRSLPETGARVTRGTKSATLRDMLDAGEKRLLGSSLSIMSRNWRPDLTSHVILAACQNYQYAKEKKVRGKNGEILGYAGIFTESLLCFLRSGAYTAETRYVDIASYLPQSLHQTPVIDGDHKDARIWYQE
ncbi:caspase domain-containing protein [Armillaria novae-zelandiae]|uniref:Caspase domain-containing protein n=1 Tax=Armillaria novae-zelandiae TaxID=153914 RepID=A0AA39PS19_9AGAR|nr:caspase domain-containing protein [Armillaria novae-zelandiae]